MVRVLAHGAIDSMSDASYVDKEIAVSQYPLSAAYALTRLRMLWSRIKASFDARCVRLEAHNLASNAVLCAIPPHRTDLRCVCNARVCA